MSWLLFKEFCAKSWVWLKEHWQIPFLVVWSIVVWVMARKDFDAALEVIDAKKKSYEEQIAAIKDAHNKEILERENLIKEYNEMLSRVEKDLEAKEKELEEHHKARIREVVVKSKNNPEKVKKEIERIFDFKHIE